MHTDEHATGTYALVMRLDAAQHVQIGKFGDFHFDSGWYVYVGSAFGPGGVRSRISRHMSLARESEKRLKWHIDYFREEATIEEVWFSHDPKAREHEWARAIAQHSRAETPVPGFGSRDCSGREKCPAHLFRLNERPVVAVFRSVNSSARFPIYAQSAQSIPPRPARPSKKNR